MKCGMCARPPAQPSVPAAEAWRRTGVRAAHKEAAEEVKRRREEAHRQRVAALQSSNMEVGGHVPAQDCNYQQMA